MHKTAKMIAEELEIAQKWSKYAIEIPQHKIPSNSKNEMMLTVWALSPILINTSLESPLNSDAN